MATIPVEIRGTLYDLATKSSRQVFIAGEAYRSDLSVGGGPMPGGGGNVIWGPTDPRPTPPIHLGPGGEVGGPPVVGGGPIIPPGEPPTGEPDGDGFIKAPPDGGWGYHQTYGWLYNPAEGQAQPKG